MKRRARSWILVLSVMLLGTGLLMPGAGGALANPDATANPAAITATTGDGPDVTAAVAHDTSPPLRELAATAPTAPATSDGGEVPSGERFGPQATAPGLAPGEAMPTAVTPQASLPAMPPTSVNFFGVTNPNGYYPPDTVGDIGPNHYVQMVNVSFVVFDAYGEILYGPVDNNVLWGGFGGECQMQNDGDPIVRYDGLADRWVLSQFAVSGEETFECVAVSATPDPLGPYHRYAFSYGTEFNDYPKLGVWPDAYYITYNIYGYEGFEGAKICAVDRAAMLTGAPATQQCFDRPQAWGLLPADVDGPTPPPIGAPNYVMGAPWGTSGLLTMYRFSVNWDDPAATTLEGPIDIAVADLTPACVDTYRGRCVPQPGTAVLLESLGGRTMFRLAYRNYGTHESLATNQTVALDGDPGLSSQLGVAWYEIRNPSTTPTVFQQGVAASDVAGQSRWMASIAMDSQGNMGLGYSSSSTTMFPSIHYLGRLASDPLGTMPYQEGLIVAGAGSQTGSSARWGDYTSMDVDPLDDCTFWYTNQFLTETSFNGWSTQVASFKFPGCNGSTSEPSAPQTPTATPGDASATLTWQAPLDNGGLPVTGYTVTASPGGATCTTVVGADADPLTCTLTGLTNGLAYTFDVVARNALGTSPVATSAQVTPSAPPQPPTSVTALPRDTAALVSWLAPADSGGIPVASYTVSATPGGATCTTPPANPVPTTCEVTGLRNGTPYTFTVTASHALGTSAPSDPSDPVTPGVIGAEFYPVVQQRVYDSRIDGGPVSADAPRLIDLGGALVPPEATAVAYNLTVTGQSASGFASVAPGDTPDTWQPQASTINWVRPAQTIANGYVSKTAVDTVKVFVGGTGSAQVIFDVVGYYVPRGDLSVSASATGGVTPAAAVFVAMPPQRVYSSATAGGAILGGGPGTLGSPVRVDLSSVLPVGASAVAFNLTATDTANTGYLLLAPGGQPPPQNASILNWTPSISLANASVVALGTDRSVDVYAGGAGSAQFLLDVTGYFLPASLVPSGETGTLFYPVLPARAYNSLTQEGLLLGNPATGGLGEPRTVSVGLGGLLPMGTRAVAYNLTATGNTGTGYLTVGPDRLAAPATSNLNWTPATSTVANGSAVGVDGSQMLSLWAGGRTGSQVIIDVGGYYR